MTKLRTDTIINRDALYALRELPSESVHCAVTSPPYYALRDYGLDAQIGREDTPKQYIEKLTDVFRELRRVLRPDGTLWLNIADPYCGTGSKRLYRPEIPAGQERAKRVRRKESGGLQAKGLNRYPVALSLFPAL